jgi:transposase
MNTNDMKTAFSASTLLDFFKLPHDCVDDVSIDRADTHVNVRVTFTRRVHRCPSCRSETSTIKDYVTKKLKHQIIHKENCLIHYRARRYKCNTCNKSFYEENPFLHHNSKLTSTIVCNVLDDLKSSNETFTSVANRYYISTPTVTRVFDEYVKPARQRLPKILCIDEVYYRKGHYACVLLDFETQEAVDILPYRRLKYLEEYLSGINKEERDNVEILCTDMWDSYIRLANFYFKNAIVVVDKFHVIQVLTKKIEMSR